MAAELKPYSGAGCAAVEAYFVEEVWAKVAAENCLKCHKAGGDAEDSKLVFRDPSRTQGKERTEAMRFNREAIAQQARVKDGGKFRLLLKSTGQVKHGGKEAVKADSAGYKILAEFVRRVNAPSAAAIAQASAEVDRNAPPFFGGVAMLEDRRLLRRVTLSLAGRLPTDAELSTVGSQGMKAMPGILDAVMKEDGFYTRLREGFNDIFLTLGVDGNPDQSVLSYEHFEKSRGWYQNTNLNKEFLAPITDAKARQQAGYKLADDYRKALLAEPMKLVEYIVRNDRPFTEIVTADYFMVSPYGARGYGIFDEVKDKFKNTADPFEFIPVKLKALTGRSKSENQDSATGFYPHAGLLGTFQYLARYPTTETNRNRQRARVYFLHFLGVDVLELAARVGDAAAVSAKFENPTMQASECVVCHKTIDPIAGLFQDYWRFADAGVYGKRKGGWFKDMFPPGYEGEDMPEAERWRALPWLGERTAKDPRFAVAMVEHAYYLVTGRKVLLPPKDLDDPLFAAKRRAYTEQRKQVEAIATRFAATGFNFKQVLKDWVASDFYRADGLLTAALNPARRAELDDLGLVRMLAPEQVERKVAAIFGKPWGRLKHGDGGLDMLYGGIDSKEVTERAADPSGAMGAIQRILANDIACKQTALDFSREPSERLLFPHIEPDVVPGTSPEADAKIRETIVRLHERVLGRLDKPDSAEVDRTYQLFAGIVSDAAEKKNLDKQENYSCRQGLLAPVPDPKYTVRAWRAVVTYLLRQHEFLYE
ncbi:MAG: hypothetical protein EBS05_02980 [Proteobacteria bacterium]|nr:hypothetical protein [Pseudomonadota bacterium]